MEDLEKVTGISSPHLQRVFKRVMSLTPRQYQEVCRIDRLKARLRDGESVTKAVNNVGYRSISWIYTNSKAKLGMNPGIYKHAGEGMKIRYGIIDSPLGRLLVARTRHGVCYLGIWDKDDPLETALRREYSSAKLIKDERKSDPWTQEIPGYLEGKKTRLSKVSIEVAGTGFQVKVWDELRTITRGSTKTYEDLARSISRTTAARAVSRACATNPVSLLIPCHRVIRKDGGLSGYVWGIERKKTLLEIEGVKLHKD